MLQATWGSPPSVSVKRAARRWGALSLRARLLLGTLAVLTASLALVTYISWTEYERARGAVLDDLEQTGLALAVAVDATFDQTILLGKALAELPELRTLDAERAGATL